jgi:hypothetical protein
MAGPDTASAASARTTPTSSADRTIDEPSASAPASPPPPGLSSAATSGVPADAKQFVHAKTKPKKEVEAETAASGAAPPPPRPTNAVSTTLRIGSSASAKSDGTAMRTMRPSRPGSGSRPGGAPGSAIVSPGRP